MDKKNLSWLVIAGIIIAAIIYLAMKAQAKAPIHYGGGTDDPARYGGAANIIWLVTDYGGLLLSGVTVTVYDDDIAIGSGITGADGRTAIISVPSGHGLGYTLRKPGYYGLNGGVGGGLVAGTTLVFEDSMEAMI